MKHYLITLISATARIERSVIAHNTVSAIRIGIAMMPELQGPVGITCKPKEVACAA